MKFRTTHAMRFQKREFFPLTNRYDYQGKMLGGVRRTTLFDAFGIPNIGGGSEKCKVHRRRGKSGGPGGQDSEAADCAPWGLVFCDERA